jgi:hypothetical protein
MSDPVHQALAARRAAKKRRRARAVEEQPERPAPPLVSQGGRSPMPRRAAPSIDDAIRRTFLELGRPRRIEL